MATKVTLLIAALALCCKLGAQTGQISVPRIDKMPDQPAPYLMRDWDRVAMKYDSFIYDVDKTGQYLPFISVQSKGINYPLKESFRLHTYVGTNAPLGNEAINVLPSIVGATLNGIDKSSQFGKNWVAMSQDFFNLANGEEIYLNNPSASSGQDWWYDMMPNVYFYQLYDLYNGINAEGERQFTRVADRFYDAVAAMGGSRTPWKPAFMNYRAWKFGTMQPNNTGVPEPEAAGAFGWILYHAYKETGSKKYLRAAEWSMEFLESWNTNPSYELQLPYGVLTAARMNAELGTQYDVAKLVNWCFDRGPLRGWGAVTGNWGGVQVSGLIGEANDAGNDYAFQMNGMQHAACLVPMVRYDKRFATAIGKWVLNLANASRFFYPGFLPEAKQDAAAWSSVYDPDRVIGYEALRQVWQGVSPYATGDAKKGGWAATNLALYGTSSVGYLGALIQKTNVDKILQLDLLKTNFFADPSYSTYLLYNPYTTDQRVQVDAGSISKDVYEMLSETFIYRGVSGKVEVIIPARQSVILVMCPENGVVTYDKNILLIDNIPVDYRQNKKSFTYSPRIKGLAAEKDPLETSKSAALYCTAEDADSPQLQYEWTTSGGTVTGTGAKVSFTSPGNAGIVTIYCRVTDEQGQFALDSVQIQVVPKINNAPVIQSIDSESRYARPGESLLLACKASDPDNDGLTYSWKAQSGTITGNDKQVVWTAPGTEGIYTIEVQVSDQNGGTAKISSSWLVYFSDSASGGFIAHYPFKGNALDISGNQLHGTPRGVVSTGDRNGKTAEAYYFNGGAQSVLVPANELLNVESAISVSVWVKPLALPDRETFIASHGSWQNRWKLSVTPEGKLRWTVNTTDGIADLDALIRLETEKYYHIVATYDGSFMILYIDGSVQSFRRMTGKLRKTTFPLLIGQMLPDITTYNFKGVIDEVILNDYALTPFRVFQAFQGISSSTADGLQVKTICPVTWNITSNILTVEQRNDLPGSVILQISGMDGHILFKELLESVEHRQFELDHLPPGVYALTVNRGINTWTFRFLKT
jgi:hypothetical protein